MSTQLKRLGSIKKLQSLSLALFLGGLIAVPGANATTLLEVYQRAQGQDPAYRSAVLERKANEASVWVSRTAYLPVGNFNIRQFENESAVRRTFSVTQPIFDLAKYATMREAAPREVLAEATFRLREQELATRVVKTVSEYLKVRELIELTKAQVDALQKQSARFQRSFELGQGTITEVRAAQVRLDQAMATQRSLSTQLEIMRKQYARLTGSTVEEGDFNLASSPARPVVADLEMLLSSVNAGNANILTARANERLADLNSQRAYASLFPTVTGVFRESQLGGGPKENYAGINVELPLGLSVQNGVSKYQAGLAADSKREETRNVEEKTRLEVERLHALVLSGVEEIKIRRDGIASAELSREAFEKSFQGGVASAVDVMNSILTVFEVKRDYLNTLTTVAENFLLLQIFSSESPVVALERVQPVLLADKK
jgi:outer membrane protein TolC